MRRSVSDLTGADAPSVARYALKSLHSVLENDRAVGILSFAAVDARADVDQQNVAGWIGIRDARQVRRIDDDRAFALQDVDRLGHQLRLRVIQTTARSLFSGHGQPLVVERARDADARAAQAVSVQGPRVI